jgi:hypothetical protein
LEQLQHRIGPDKGDPGGKETKHHRDPETAAQKDGKGGFHNKLAGVSSGQIFAYERTKYIISGIGQIDAMASVFTNA